MFCRVCGFRVKYERLKELTLTLIYMLIVLLFARVGEVIAAPTASLITGLRCSAIEIFAVQPLREKEKLGAINVDGMIVAMC